MLLFAALALALPSAPVADVDWLIVRGESELIEPASYAKISSIYLKPYTTEIVGVEQAGKHPEASRVVVGTLADNALVEDLARSLGLTFEGDEARFLGKRYGAGTGFVLVGRDPDGEGLLALITGADAQSLFNCFTVSLDITQAGYSVLQLQKRIAAGPLMLDVDLTRPVVIRLDQDLERLTRDTEGWPDGDRELRIARGLAGFGHVFGALTGRSDPLPGVQAALIDVQGLVRDARRAFAGRDLTAEILAIYQQCRDELGGAAAEADAPAIYVVLDPSSKTNGKSFGNDPATGRPQLVLNLAVLGRAGNFDAVCVHECLHSFQHFEGERAVDRGMREGTATLGTQLVDPSVGDAEALLWSDAELAAAEARRDALVEGFRRIAGSTDAQVHHGWFTLDATLDAVPGAPSRSGYYVCWLASRAWLDEEPGRTLGDLLAASADELLAALD